MKRQATRLVVVGALALLSMALPSCKKGCYECTKAWDTTYECRESHPNQKSFNSALDYLEANGYSCKKQ